jgi:hypothetical protein
VSARRPDQLWGTPSLPVAYVRLPPQCWSGRSVKLTTRLCVASCLHNRGVLFDCRIFRTPLSSDTRTLQTRKIHDVWQNVMPSLLGDAGCKFINSFVLNIQWLGVCGWVCARACVCWECQWAIKSPVASCFCSPSCWQIPQDFFWLLYYTTSLLQTISTVVPPTFFSLLASFVLFRFVLFDFALLCLFHFLITMLVESYLFVCFWRDNPPLGQGLLIQEVARSYTATHHSR